MAVQEQLYELYLLDRQVRGMRSRLDFATRRFTQQEIKLKQLQRQKSELADQLKLLQVKAGDLENEIRSADERVEHLRQQMNTVTSNKEYSALLVEVNSLKEDRNKIEDQALQHMEEIERVKQQIQQIDNQADQQSTFVTQAQQAVENCRTEVGAQLDSLTGEHSRAMEQLPPTVQTVFNRLQDTHEGEAMAAVTGRKPPPHGIRLRRLLHCHPGRTC